MEENMKNNAYNINNKYSVYIQHKKYIYNIIYIYIYIYEESVLVTQSCPTLCDPMDCM